MSAGLSPHVMTTLCCLETPSSATIHLIESWLAAHRPILSFQPHPNPFSCLVLTNLLTLSTRPLSHEGCVWSVLRQGSACRGGRKQEEGLQGSGRQRRGLTESQSLKDRTKSPTPLAQTPSEQISGAFCLRTKDLTSFQLRISSTFFLFFVFFSASSDKVSTR